MVDEIIDTLEDVVWQLVINRKGPSHFLRFSKGCFTLSKPACGCEYKTINAAKIDGVIVYLHANVTIDMRFICRDCLALFLSNKEKFNYDFKSLHGSFEENKPYHMTFERVHRIYEFGS
jgi:hypothetical protein